MNLDAEILPPDTNIIPAELTRQVRTRAPRPAQVRQAMTPMDMLSMAVQQGADIDKLKQLMDLQERWEANEAKKAFHAAMGAFKANPPEIFKTKHVKYTKKDGTTTEYDHGDLGEIADAISASMAPHGLSFRWSIEQIQGGRVRVACILSHTKGHSESVSMEGPLDDSGGKNAIQSGGSSVSYLERYTLLAISGTAVKGQDTDAMLPGMPENSLASITDALDMKSLLENYTKAYKSAKTKGEMAAIISAKDKRKTELEGGAL